MPEPFPPKRPVWKRVDFFLCLLVVLAALMGYLLLAPQSTGGLSPLAAPYEGEEPELSAEEASLPVEQMPKSGPVVRFLMLNAKNYFVEGEQQRSRYVNKPKPEEERDAVAQVIASAAPAVVGLVEIGGPRALADLQQRLRAAGLEYPHARVLTRGGEDRALALLSVYPIVQDHSRADYGLYGHQRRKLLRGILDVTVQTNDARYFRIVGAHLKSRAGDDEPAAAALRYREAHTLAFYLRAVMQVQPHMPILVFGDWNDTPSDASLRLLEQGVSRQSALRRLKPRDSRGEEWTHYFRRGNSYHTFDVILVNSPLRKRMKSSDASGVVDIPAAETASDHRAVWCELR